MDMHNQVSFPISLVGVLGHPPKGRRSVVGLDGLPEGLMLTRGGVGTLPSAAQIDRHTEPPAKGAKKWNECSGGRGG